MLLQTFGHKVIAITASGEDAIDIAKQKKPDLIFMDIDLKGDLDGIDTAKMIIEKHNIRIIFCSAFNDDHTLLRASVVNPAGYITKPFELEDIEELMNLHARSCKNEFSEEAEIEKDIYKKKIC